MRQNKAGQKGQSHITTDLALEFLAGFLQRFCQARQFPHKVGADCYDVDYVGTRHNSRFSTGSLSF